MDDSLRKARSAHRCRSIDALPVSLPPATGGSHAASGILGFDDIFFPLKLARTKSQICSKEARVQDIHYLHSGVCVGYDLLADGRRQVIAVYLPGDLINAGAIYRKRGGQNVLVMSDATIGAMSLNDIERAIAENARLRDMVLHEVVKRHAMLEAWICTLGRKSAIERMAMFFCEICRRMEMAGKAEGKSCFVPLNQVDLADILGISVVHANRVLKIMRETDLASFDGGRLDIHDFSKMASIAEFDPDYLV